MVEGFMKILLIFFLDENEMSKNLNEINRDFWEIGDFAEQREFF